MKTLVSAAPLFALAFLLGAASPASRAATASEGDSATATAEKPTAPEWSVKNLDGGAIRSADFKGKVIVVDFWATWCGPCVSEIPGYMKLQKKYAAQGLVFVGLSIDEGGADVVRKFVKAHKVNYTIGLSDDKVQQAFGGFEAIPTTFVIDREGRIAFKKTGAMPEEEFENVLKPLLK